MRNIKNSLLILLLALTSCSSLTNHGVAARDKAYLSARSIPPLQIPPGLSSDTISEEYPVSDNVYPESVKTVSLIPPELPPARK